MRRLRFEEDPRDPANVVTLVLACAAGLAGYVWAGWPAGFLGFLLVGSLVLVLADGYRNAAVTEDVGDAARLAVAAAKQKYPEEVPCDVKVISVDGVRCVFSIWYSRGLFSPVSKRFFAVTRIDPSVVEEVDGPRNDGGRE
jgi:hypothetical protein